MAVGIQPLVHYRHLLVRNVKKFLIVSYLDFFNAIVVSSNFILIFLRL